jgi:hypothetical protein
MNMDGGIVRNALDATDGCDDTFLVGLDVG